MKKFDSLLICSIATASLILFGGCSTTHHKAEASLESSMYDQKGPSFDDEKDDCEVGFNLGYLIIEDLVYWSLGQDDRYKEDFDGNYKESASENAGSNFSPYQTYRTEKGRMKGSLYLSEGLDFVNKNSKATRQASGFNNGFTAKANLFYLQIPVLVNYRYPLSKDNSLHFGLGHMLLLVYLAMLKAVE